MDYSIVMPVYNRADLTRDCLRTLPPTLAGAGNGELIVVDNGSQSDTADVLAEFPWVRVIRNEVNLGFAAACNQGAAAAAGQDVCFLNNDMIAHAGWLAKMRARGAPDVGIVGARLFFPDGTIQHAGVATLPMRFGIEGILPYHLYWGATNVPAAAESAELDIVTGACLLTPRELFTALGGFDPTYWNGYEDVDYCLRVRERGLRVIYEADATLLHLESQSGVQRKRRLSYNLQTLAARWGSRVEPDHNFYLLRGAQLRREMFPDNARAFSTVALPPVTVVVHGSDAGEPEAFSAALAANHARIERLVRLTAGNASLAVGAPSADVDDVAAVRRLLEGRSDRYFAFVHAQSALAPGWLDELINAIEYGHEVIAATVAPEGSAGVEPCAADGRCTLLNLRNVPAHLRIGPVQTLDAAIVDLTWQAVQAGSSVRSVRRGRFGALPAPVEDPVFAARYGTAHDVLRRADAQRLEAACRDRPAAPTLASIVMLSWNAPGYTQTAVDSIRAVTRTPYEIIIVDNGSGPETLAMLARLEGVQVIYNSENKGFAYGCNQGLAAAGGTHVVLLNNDVVVTAGWLESLLSAHARDPLVGISAPRSNRVVGHQQIGNLAYASIEAMHAFAAERSREFAGMHYRTDRAIGFCLCISRNVIEEVGGIDTRYGVGNFEDDDFCIRVRAAGYQIVVCQDAFIHHFGSVSFAANKVDYASQMQKNWQIFAARWNLPAAYPLEGYNAAPAIAAGFVRERDYVPLPQPEPEPAPPARAYATAFVALVDGDAAWSRIGPIVTNYIRALSADDPSLFAIGVTGAADATTIGARIARSIGKLQIEERHVADIDVADIEDSRVGEWLTAIPASARLSIVKDDRLAGLRFAADRSPSGLARAVRGDRR